MIFEDFYAEDAREEVRKSKTYEHYLDCWELINGMVDQIKKYASVGKTDCSIQIVCDSDAKRELIKEYFIERNFAVKVRNHDEYSVPGLPFKIVEYMLQW